MKKIFLFIFLSAVLSSCDACRPENYAHVEFRDSTSGNFLLQSFSDSTIRMFDFIKDSMHVVPFHYIRRFFLQGDEIDIYSSEGKARMQKSLKLRILWGNGVVTR
jgi:hypothetical protein